MGKTENGVKQAMILAAGLGTRLKPWTDHHPKALALVNGKPLLQHNIRYLQRYGIYDVVVNVHHFAGQIEEAVAINKGWGSNIVLSDEKDQVLETGGGLKKAGSFFEAGDFVLMNVDLLTDLDLHAMIRAHCEHAPLASLAVRNRDTSRYFLFDHNELLCGWKNTQTGEQILIRDEPAPVQKAFSGLHIISSRIFPLLTMEGKFSMVNAYLQLAATHPIRAFDHTAGKFIDVGTPGSLLKAENYFS